MDRPLLIFMSDGLYLLGARLSSPFQYRRFVWISSSMKGPFQPAYVETAWHTAFTERLNKDVKLVGSTISCTSLMIDKAQPSIEHPHVQVWPQ